MELGTGATLSIVSEKTYQSLFSPQAAPHLKPPTTQLKTYTGEVLRILGEITVTVCYKDQKSDLSLLVVARNGPSLLGHDWLSQIKLDWKQLHQSNHVRACQWVYDKYLLFSRVNWELCKELWLSFISIQMFSLSSSKLAQCHMRYR